MARLVVVRFTDNEEAERFAEENRDTVWIIDGLDPDNPKKKQGWAKVRVLGLFAWPTSYCICSGTFRGKNRIKGWSRGKKYGWWVHRCGRPSKLWGSSIHAVIADGINLLKEE